MTSSAGPSSSPDPARFLSRETPRVPRSPLSWANHSHPQNELPTGLPPLFLGAPEQPSKRRAQGETSGTSHTWRGLVVGNKNGNINAGGGRHSPQDRKPFSLGFVHLFSAAFLVLVFVSKNPGIHPPTAVTTVPERGFSFSQGRQTPVPGQLPRAPHPIPRFASTCAARRQPCRRAE